MVLVHQYSPLHWKIAMECRHASAKERCRDQMTAIEESKMMDIHYCPYNLMESGTQYKI